MSATQSHLSPITGHPTPTVPTAYARGGWRLVRCVATGLVFLPNPPAYSELSESLAWESTHRAERRRRLEEEPVATRIGALGVAIRKALVPRRNPFAAMLAAHLARRPGSRPGGGRPLVVDVGCAAGVLSLAVARSLRARGIEAGFMGIELSRRLAAEGAQRLSAIGGTVVEASAIDGLRRCTDGSVSAVLMSSFLEHEAQPLELLREVRRTLEPGGVAIVKVPNFACWNRRFRGARWCGFRYPDHVIYFTPSTLRLLARNAGLGFRQGLLDRHPLSDNMYARLLRPFA